MSRTSKLLAKGTVKATKAFIEDVKDEVKKEEQAQDEPVQLDLPLEDPNETAERA